MPSKEELKKDGCYIFLMKWLTLLGLGSASFVMVVYAIIIIISLLFGVLLLCVACGGAVGFLDAIKNIPTPIHR